ncbi:hypothetical protein ATE67_11770 [Sphingopyxis sp. H050]|jgi:glycosyltransferase involved in cell wall biosynthesis|uniref:glycosyltransferase n=1 Tax=Sphingopyxis sp. H050 TaxID=1759072 RepID=UPI000736A6DE|nr:glycosyltransferase [Sphingopyxis sp. H050]KTE20062.1 hypothetical protein ATE67_11770 [Sphingopyxis sp. H050]
MRPLSSHPANSPPVLSGTYVLPIAARTSQARLLTGYLTRLARMVEDVIVVDGSSPDIFDDHAAAWGSIVRHMPPARRTRNGKVGNVMTGIEAAIHERIIVADDDVRYRRREIQRMLDLLDHHAVIRPQNYFAPLPWHARWDTGRSLLNRVAGGDWPGTLGVQQSTLIRAGGYSGDVLFENLEMVRTIRAIGGTEAVPLDLYVARRPPHARHFLSQRVRQAYDEWARPARFAAQLALVPVILVGAVPAALSIAAAAVLAAEVGRRRSGGCAHYSKSSPLWAALWIAERSVTSWIALAEGLFNGGVRYRGGRLRRAASSARALRLRMRQRAAGES